MWDRFDNEQGKIVAHDLYPLEIVVEGDTAVVDYFYSSAYQNKKDEVKTSHGRYTEVLIRTEDGWKFIGWYGGDD
jgi:ketosteroid isomerase-like protein